MSRWFIALFAAALVVAPAAIPRSKLALEDQRVVTVPPGGVRAPTIRCDSGFLAVSGGVKTPGDGTTTLAVRPDTARAFSLRVGNPAGNPGQQVTLAVACRAALHGRRLRVRHVHTKQLSVPAHAQKRVSLACPRGTLTAGAGYDLAPGSTRPSAPFDLRRQTRTLKRFSFTVRNGTSSARPAVFYGTCVAVVNGRLQVRLTTVTTPVQPGTQVLTRNCRSDWFSLATGYALPTSMSLGGSVATRGGGSWTLTNAGPGQPLVELQLACARVLPL